MRLIVDTSVLVGELLRASSRARLGDDRLELFMAEAMWSETQVELPRRINAFAKRKALPRKVADELMGLCLEAVTADVAVLEESIYSALEDEALARSERDPRDWPAVACALALAAGVWTADSDFLGTGVATWTAATLQRWLQRHPDG